MVEGVAFMANRRMFLAEISYEIYVKLIHPNQAAAFNMARVCSFMEVKFFLFDFVINLRLGRELLMI